MVRRQPELLFVTAVALGLAGCSAFGLHDPAPAMGSGT